jgi:DNA polymerase-1
MQALGPVCKDRDTAKTFIYAWLLGAGIAKVAQILNCKNNEAKEAVTSFLNRITGLKYLKEEVIPRDANRGYFIGLDGRAVICDSEHLMLAGYLQNGESVIMKRANVLWRNRLLKEKIPFKQVDFVHDEWQTEVPDDLELATYIAKIQADSIRQVGEDLKLNCPMAGSILNQHKQLAIGANWSITH